MSGYTPIFSSVFQGTLCGKYPDLPVWLVLLALADRHGEIDAHPSYIATISGIPQADIEKAIKNFCEPDPRSRTPDEDGRRLIPLPGRGFGWSIVNFGKYREKARLAAKSQREVESGRNAERIAHRRRPPVTAGDRPAPPVTDPSDSDTNINPPTPRKRGEVSDDPPIPEGPDPVVVVFDHWRKVHGHPKAGLDKKRRAVIRRALATYSVDDLRACIDGYKHSPHHMGQNDRGTVFDAIELFLRDAAHIDAGIKHGKPKEQPWM